MPKKEEHPKKITTIDELAGCLSQYAIIPRLSDEQEKAWFAERMGEYLREDDKRIREQA
jgi:hypothetical protein